MSLLKKRVKTIGGNIARALARIGVIPCKIIIRMDGGICSQMHFYLVGKMLEARGNKVSYDLKWYSTDGKDLDGRFSRNFDLLKIFPNLDFKEETNSILKRFFISFLYYRNEYFSESEKEFDWQHLKAPLYLDGYFRDPEDMFSLYYDKLFRADTTLLPDDNKEILRAIESAEDNFGACSMHVRRGDLSRYNAAYGSPTEVGYFVSASRTIIKSYPGTKFFIFSDEPEWCIKEILPHLEGIETEIIDINGSDRGWCDLLLMSRCRHQITSQGSMGKYAALLRERKDRGGMVLIPGSEENKKWLKRYKNAKTFGN